MGPMVLQSGLEDVVVADTADTVGMKMFDGSSK